MIDRSNVSLVERGIRDLAGKYGLDPIITLQNNGQHPWPADIAIECNGQVLEIPGSDRADIGRVAEAFFLSVLGFALINNGAPTLLGEGPLNTALADIGYAGEPTIVANPAHVGTLRALARANGMNYALDESMAAGSWRVDWNGKSAGSLGA